MNRLLALFPFRPFQRIIGSSACKLCPCQTGPRQADRFHLSPRTTVAVSDRRSSETLTKLSLSNGYLRSSAFLLFGAIPRTTRYRVSAFHHSNREQRHHSDRLTHHATGTKTKTREYDCSNVKRSCQFLLIFMLHAYRPLYTQITSLTFRI
jgi:hypothetical protein